jgi:hypothetical protein
MQPMSRRLAAPLNLQICFVGVQHQRAQQFHVWMSTIDHAELEQPVAPH